MKNYYDLTKSDREKYLKEFKKTPVGKEMNYKLICYWIITFALCGISGFISGLTEDFVEVNKDVDLFVSIMEMLFIFCMIFSTLYSAYLNLNFTSWLKNKYEIKRW